jgi:hypothetical protein
MRVCPNKITTATIVNVACGVSHWPIGKKLMAIRPPVEKSRIGGKREGAGRPAPLGRKEVCSVRLTPDVAKFCREHPDGFTVLEDAVRNSKAFRNWLKAQK